MFLFGLLWLLGVTKRLSLGFSHALMSFVCLVVGDIAFLLLTFFDVGSASSALSVLTA